jgi:hypothetical protein
VQIEPTIIHAPVNISVKLKQILKRAPTLNANPGQQDIESILACADQHYPGALIYFSPTWVKTTDTLNGIRTVYPHLPILTILGTLPTDFGMAAYLLEWNWKTAYITLETPITEPNIRVALNKARKLVGTEAIVSV